MLGDFGPLPKRGREKGSKGVGGVTGREGFIGRFQIESFANLMSGFPNKIHVAEAC